MNSAIPRQGIDTSLAKSIRRGFFKRLGHEWEAYDQRRRRAAGRNVMLSSPIESRKQFRDRLALLEKFAGPLLPSCTLRIESGSRAAAVVWALRPEGDLSDARGAAHAGIRALVLLQPGRLVAMDVAVHIWAHAVDRVVQRAHVVDLPIRDVDMLAVNAEFSDLMPLACLAARVLTEHACDQGEATAEAVNVLLPTQHGVFLGRRSASTHTLEIRTFVDHAKLNEAQLEAVKEIHRLSQERVCTEALQALVPGWMGSAPEDGLRRQLFEAWQHYGWRFEEDRLHPGMSDQAWKEHDVSRVPLASAGARAMLQPQTGCA